MTDTRTDSRTATTSVGSAPPQLSGARAGAFTAYRVLIGVFLLALLVQVFLAGLGIFGADVAATDDGSTELDAHRAFGHIISQPLALLVLLAAAVARPGRKIVQLTIGWFVLGIVQVALGIAGGDTAVLGGLHALNALLYVGLTVELLRRATTGRRAGR